MHSPYEQNFDIYICMLALISRYPNINKIINAIKKTYEEWHGWIFPEVFCQAQDIVQYNLLFLAT